MVPYGVVSYALGIALALHYAQLEALAFNEEFDRDEVDDFTAPPTQVIKKVPTFFLSTWSCYTH